MLWISLIIALLCTWSFLGLLANERDRRMQEIEQTHNSNHPSGG